MNNVYFACQDCKKYIDAGYRSTLSTLYLDQWDQFPITVSVDEVLSYKDPLDSVADRPYLAGAVPSAHYFLVAHQTHNILFGDDESFKNFDEPNYSYLQWLDVGSLEEPTLNTTCFEPRYFVEHQSLRFSSWSQVEAYCGEHYCSWSDDAYATAVAKNIFLQAVQEQEPNYAIKGTSA
jgi:hypothetical protein